jgi:hypothetical protein
MPNISIRKGLDLYAVSIIGIIGIVFAVYWNYTHPHVVVKYDCSISEISPDYPIAVKEGCRKLRAKYFQENLQKPK